MNFHFENGEQLEFSTVIYVMQVTEATAVNVPCKISCVGPEFMFYRVESFSVWSNVRSMATSSS